MYSHYIFGKPWGPWYDYEVGQRVKAPLGIQCYRCEEPIAADDSGMIQPMGSRDGVSSVAIHRECFLRQIIGPVNHQLKRCVCFGGTQNHDPEDVSRRMAAELAVLVRELVELGRTPEQIDAYLETRKAVSKLYLTTRHLLEAEQSLLLAANAKKTN